MDTCAVAPITSNDVGFPRDSTCLTVYWFVCAPSSITITPGRVECVDLFRRLVHTTAEITAVRSRAFRGRAQRSTSYEHSAGPAARSYPDATEGGSAKLSSTQDSK